MSRRNQSNAAPSAHAPVARYVTDASGNRLLERLNDVNWFPIKPHKQASTITLDVSVQYQRMDGFGAALTDSSSRVISELPTSARDELMAELFKPGIGAGLSAVRLPISASDFATGNYTYADRWFGSDRELKCFSITRDHQATIPLLKQALALNPDLFVMASSWSPPRWMKRWSWRLGGGRLKSSHYETYARYLVKVVQAYAEQGITIHALTVQNEPLKVTYFYPSMRMDASDQARFIGDFLGPAFEAAKITTKIIAHDYNWNDTEYPLRVLGDQTAGPFVRGTAWHAYAGTVDAQSKVHEAFPGKETHFTEITASQPGNFGGDLMWHQRNVMLGAVNHWAQSVMYWNLALDEHNGPRNGAYAHAQPVLTITSGTGEIKRNMSYYSLAHTARFVRPEARRIRLELAEGSGVHATAYRNTNGSRVLVVANDSGIKRMIMVRVGSVWFADELNLGDLRTYVWSSDRI